MALTDTPTRSAEGALTQKSGAETVGLVAGVVGLTASIYGLFLFAMDPKTLSWALGNWIVGVLGVALYAVTNRRAFARALAGRSTILLLLEIGTGVGLLGAGGALNYWCATHPKEWDLTRDGIYTLHEQSIKVAEGLKQKVTVYGFFAASESGRNMLTQAVSLYKTHTDQIEVVFINPNSIPRELALRFDMSSQSPRVVIAAENGRFAKLKTPTEESMTNALLKVAERPARFVRFLSGHKEPGFDDPKLVEGYSIIASQLRNDGYTVESLSLIDKDEVPADTSVLLLAGEQQALFGNEIEAVSEFVSRGGRVVALLEPGIQIGLDPLWKQYGLSIGDDMILDPSVRASDSGPETPVVQSFETHPITTRLGNTAALFHYVRSVVPRVGMPDIEAVTLAQTSPASWAEVDYKNGSEHARDENDIPGPVPIAVAVKKRTIGHPQKISDEARLVVFGDFHFASNRFASMGADGELLLNSVSWAAGEEDRIVIRPAPATGDRLPLTQSQQDFITFFSVNLMPLMITGFGFSVWAVRRRK